MKRRFLIFFISIIALVFWPLKAIAACETPEQQPVENPQPQPMDKSSDIHLNELFPNPSGDEATLEFIELINTGARPVNLEGWKVRDANGTTFVLTKDDFDSIEIQPSAWFIIDRKQSGIALNNNEETVTLLWPDETVVESISYKNAPEDQSFARIDNVWNWTKIVTPEQENRLSETEPKEIDPEQNNPPSPHEDKEEEKENDKKQADPQQSEQPKEYQFSNDIFLTELLPDPEGDDAEGEWIELMNAGSTDIRLFGWKISDANTSYAFPEETVIPAGSFSVVERADSGITLNNASDEIFLINPKNEIVNGVAYSESYTAKSFARKETTEQWQWTDTPTKGLTNTLNDAELHEERKDTSQTPNEQNKKNQTTEEETKESTSPKQPQIPKMTLDEVYRAEKGAVVRTSGLVTVEPYILDETSFYISDGQRGLKIYFGQSNPLKLTLGDELEITGTVSESYGERRLHVKEAEDIHIKANRVGEIQPVNINNRKIEENDLGQLVIVRATLAKQRKTELEVFNDQGEIVIVPLIAKNLIIETWPKESQLQITGILRKLSGGPKLYPRYADDIVAMKSSPLETNTHPVTSLSEDRSSTSNTPSPIQNTFPRNRAKASAPIISIAISIFVVAAIVGFLALDERYKIIASVKKKLLDRYRNTKVAKGEK